MPATDIFSEYMASTDNLSHSPTEDEAWAQFQQQPGFQSSSWVQGEGMTGHSTNRRWSRRGMEFQAFKAKLGVKDKIGQGFEPAYGYVKGGSQAAGALLRQGYEDAFRARAAGYTGQLGQEQEALGVNAVTQGLSPDVAARMLSQRRAGGLQSLAGYRADYGSQLGTGLSELAKGTGTELAGLSAQEAAVRANYEAAIKGAQMAANAANSAGAMGALGSVGGGVAMGIAMCDERIKEDIAATGNTAHGVPIFEFKYKPGLGLPDGRFRGPMSQDVEKVFPSAVFTTRGGVQCLRLSSIPTELHPVRIA